MNCRTFDRDLPDWVAGRLPAEQVRNMAQHQERCPQCQQALLAERALQRRLADLPPPTSVPEIGPRLAQRLALERSAPFGMGRRQPVWAFGGALATVGLTCALLWSAVPPRPSSGNLQSGSHTVVQEADASVDESVIVQKISEFQQLPDAESERFIANAGQQRSVQRTFLLGEEAQ